MSVIEPVISAVVRATVDASPVLIDREAGLTLTGTVANPSAEFNSQTFTTSSNCVLAIDFTGLTPSPGLILEVGGSGTGAYIGFDSNIDFVVRAGNGSARWNAATAYTLVSGADRPSGNGTLVVQFGAGLPISAKAWWNGVPVGTQVDNTLTSATWAGSNAANYFATSPSMVSDEIATALTTFTTASSLRYYNNQVVS